MLAEIFMLQLEAAARSAKEAEAATSARFVPITSPATNASPSAGLNRDCERPPSDGQ
jgi:hypothetical protein